MQTARQRRIGFGPTLSTKEIAAKARAQLKPTLVLTRAGAEVVPGSVLLKPGAALPFGMRIDLRRMAGWDLVCGLDGVAMDRRLRQAGWHFFFMVPEVDAAAMGLDPQKTFAKALGRIVRAMEAQRFNAVEIATVKRRKWLGIEYVSITAHPRSVRDSPFLRDPAARHYPKGLWDSKRIFHVRNRQAPQRKAM